MTYVLKTLTRVEVGELGPDGNEREREGEKELAGIKIYSFYNFLTGL